MKMRSRDKGAQRVPKGEGAAAACKLWLTIVINKEGHLFWGLMSKKNFNILQFSSANTKFTFASLVAFSLLKPTATVFTLSPHDKLDPELPMSREWEMKDIQTVTNGTYQTRVDQKG